MRIPRIAIGATLCVLAPACLCAGQDESAQKFDVLEYRVLGNSVLPPVEIERTLYPLLGTGKALADVEAARAALENAYRTAGYGTVFVDIPEQDTAEGIIRLKVTEGRLERTAVSGARYFSGRQIKAGMPSAEAGTVPHLPTIQAELTALNAETTDRTVTPVLKAGKSPATIDLALNVQDELPLHGRVEVNDQYSTNTTRLRAIASLSYDNLFGRLDSLSLQLQTAPQDTQETLVWAASYTTRLPDNAKLAAFYINSDSNVSSVGSGGSSVDVLGKGSIYGLRYIRTLQTQPEATHVLVAGLEYKDFTEGVFSTDVLQTPVSYLNLSVGPISNWRFEDTQWSLSATANFGLRGRYNDPVEFAEKRFRARPNYFYLRADGSMQWSLPYAMALRARLGGQFAVDSIISNEQYSIAGADGVRGYREAEVLGDMAIKSSLELALPALRPKDGAVQGFLFFDFGRMERLNPLREQEPRTGALLGFLEPTHVDLASTGVGIDFSMAKYFSAQLSWAYPLRDAPLPGGTQADESRLLFYVRSAW